MTSRRFAYALCFALGLLACNGCGASPAPNKTASDKPLTSSTVAQGMTGGLSEEEFKALHELKTGAPAKLDGQDITVDGTKAYLSLPDAKKTSGIGIVVIHEWWGLNDNIRHWTDRLAKDGYAALAIDLYDGVVAKTPDDAMKAMKAVDDKKALATLLAAHDFLEKDPRVMAKKTGSIGWCFGGAWSLRLAMNEPDLDAAVIYYGHLVTNPDELKNIKADLLGIFGNRDKAITPDDVNAFEAALGKTNVKHTIFRFDADHAFGNPSNPRYDQKSAAEAWAHVHEFFGKTLAGK